MSAEHFFIVGAQRSGTTHLYRLLARHPEIDMAVPVRPEPKFFLLDDLFGRGLPYYEATYFGGRPGAWLRGEKTVSYMESDKAARRIAESFPASRIVFLLRDPVDRAISHYWFSVENGVETLPIEEAFDREDDREGGPWRGLSMSPFRYRRRGCYLQDIERYERLFGRERLRILLYEDLVRNSRCFRELCRWLGVSDAVVPGAPPREAGREDRPRDPISPQLRRRLVEFFARPNADLAERYGIDLGVWTERWTSPPAGGPASG